MRQVWWIAVWAPVLYAQQVVPDRYIVELEGRQSVRAQQTRMRPSLEQSGAHVVAAVETVANALIMEIPPGQVTRVLSLAGVARVRPVRLARPFLDRALLIHHVPDAWTAIGGVSKAGAGVKIAIIDSGIAQDHPAFQGASAPPPPGFPLANQIKDLAYTNNKVIVARNYVALATPQDSFGHGTAVAMEAAGSTAAGPLGAITGVAPQAWLGNYKVYQNEDPFGEDTVLRAIEDAVNDGMDVINLSLGVSIAQRPQDDILVAAVERAASLGVIVTVAAGNSGDAPNTIASPATAPSALAVGASVNDRIFAPGAVRSGSESYYAIPGYGRSYVSPVTAPLADVAALDATGEACSTLPAGSLTGRIALIARSPRSSTACSFALKLNNAQSAGAVAAIVYMHPDNPDLVTMDVSASTLPAVSVDTSFATTVRREWQAGAPPVPTILFTTSALPRNANAIADFSSRGPNADYSIKPDLVATGEFVYTATQKTNPFSFLYGATGFIKDADGTSFSAPLAAGAAALLKSARPGLTAAQYRSLLVNSATPMDFPAQWTGAGLLNVSAALSSTVAVAPVSLGFGTGPGTADMTKELTLTNLSTADDTFTISVEGPALTVDNPTVVIAAGASRRVGARFAGQSLMPGEYQGYVHIHATESAVDTVLPYWYGVPDRIPKYVTELETPQVGSPGTPQDIYFRVTDLTGLALSSPLPAIRPVGVLGSVVSVKSEDSQSPGLFHAVVLLGQDEGPNVFEITAGAVKSQFTIQGQL